MTILPTKSGGAPSCFALGGLFHLASIRSRHTLIHRCSRPSRLHRPTGLLHMSHDPFLPFTLIDRYRIEVQDAEQRDALSLPAGFKPVSPLRKLWMADGSVALSTVDEELERNDRVISLITRALRHDAAQADNGDDDGAEIVSWVDNEGRDLMPGGLPRLTVHKLNILHKGAGILVRDLQGRIFVHRRADHKRIFPSMYDMYVGGVSLYGEDTDTTARRELMEELGLGAVGAPFTFMFRCMVETSYNRCLVDVYEYIKRDEEVVRLDTEEVQWGQFMGLSEVEEKVAGEEWEFVPDGLIVWRHQLEYWRRSRP